MLGLARELAVSHFILFDNSKVETHFGSANREMASRRASII